MESDPINGSSSPGAVTLVPYEVNDASVVSSSGSTDFASCDISAVENSRLSEVHGDSGRVSSSDASTPVFSKEDPAEEVATSCCTTNGENAEQTPTEATSHSKREKLSEADLMKERFARLLLGEDMSGGRKGVSSALALSNAITNLSASVFGNLWKLEPLSPSRRKLWKREMGWLVSVTDHIVELVPTWQTFPDGGSVEVMVANPRPDLQINLPALRKLDMMLIECLESFKAPEFWYVEQEHMVCCKDKTPNRSVSRHEGKWWLPVPKVPPSGLSDDSKKALVQQKESTSQIFKAAMAINAQVLSEMEVPEIYLEALPKNGKAILGELYRSLASEDFSAEAVLNLLDLSTEHYAVEFANRIEAAIHVWQHKLLSKQPPAGEQQNKFNPRNSWVIVKEFVADVEKKEVLMERAERLLACLKQKFGPGLPQTLLDMHKIQYNKDVGQAVLESYSRVLESLSFSIIARIDGVLSADEGARGSYFASSDSSSQMLSSSQSTSGLSTDSSSLASKDSSHRTKSLLLSPGKTLADYIKVEPFGKRIYAPQAAVNHQWPCHLEQSPLARD